MKKLIVFLCAIFLVFGIAGVANASLITGTQYDVNKTADPDDNNLCWAAASSNMLYYSGWSGDPAVVSTADDIFGEYIYHWQNEYGHPFYGVEWWFTGVNSSQDYLPDSKWADVESPGGAHYPGQFSIQRPGGVHEDEWTCNYRGAGTGSVGDDHAEGIMEYVAEATDKNMVWAVLLANTGTELGAHVVTGWGYDFYTSSNPNNPSDTEAHISITDSDDGLTGVQTYEVVLANNKWVLQDYTLFGGNLYMYDIIWLANNDPVVQAQPHIPHDGPPPVPEPATMLLLGSGLIGLVGLGRKKFFRR